MDDQQWRMKFESRLSQIEDRLTTTERAAAVDEVHRIFVERQLDEIKNSIGSVRGVITQVVWLIIGTLITGVMGFVLNGGLING
jgi:preprotein translocase subunit Sec63